MPAALEVIAIISILIVLDVSAVLWGVDSRDGMDSPEWERRQAWFRR